MATEEEIEVCHKILNNPTFKDLAEALGILAEKEFGHILDPGENGEAWRMVGALMVNRIHPLEYTWGWAIERTTVQTLIKEKESERRIHGRESSKVGSTGLGDGSSSTSTGYATDWD